MNPPKSQKEADRLRAEWKKAATRSYETRIRYGDDSKDYAAEEKVVGDLWVAYKKVRPVDSKKWL